MHKRVCGEHSNPFQWPYFNEIEINEMMAYVDKPLKPSPMAAPQTWLDSIAPHLHLRVLSDGCETRESKLRVSSNHATRFSLILTPPPP